MSVVGTSKPDGKLRAPLQRSLDGEILTGQAAHLHARAVVYHCLHPPASAVILSRPCAHNGHELKSSRPRPTPGARSAARRIADGAQRADAPDTGRGPCGGALHDATLHPGGTTFIRKATAATSGFMALLIEGEVVVESIP